MVFCRAAPCQEQPDQGPGSASVTGRGTEGGARAVAVANGRGEVKHGVGRVMAGEHIEEEEEEDEEKEEAAEVIVGEVEGTATDNEAAEEAEGQSLVETERGLGVSDRFRPGESDGMEGLDAVVEGEFGFLKSSSSAGSRPPGLTAKSRPHSTNVSWMHRLSGPA